MTNATTRLLSARQAEVAELVAVGKSNREIAGALFLTERTVESHITAIFAKLEVRSRTELAVAVLRSSERDEARTALHVESNLPIARKSLIGRDAEIAQISVALHAHPLVTLTGTGGIGKTRIALEVGANERSRMDDGVWFVDLAPLTDGAAVIAAVARVFGIAEPRDTSLLVSLITHIRNKSLLLILDNCEHVIAEAARVADEILQACPHAGILATSREPLRIGVEQTYPLSALSPAAAITLFIERAKAVAPRFADHAEMAAGVSEICYRLDGLPLAIELAAARVGVLSVGEIAANLERRFDLLTHGERTALPRHQTLRALLDWSFDLLTPAEQRLFAYLSIFAGGCTLAAVAEVMSADGMPFKAIFDVLSSLVEKSLVSADSETREARYSLLESSRLYAREKLIALGEAAAAAARHARVYAGLAEHYERAYATEPDRVWRANSEAELENWRAALRWALQPDGDTVVGQQLAGSLGPVWRHFGYSEGRRWVSVALELVSASTPKAVIARLAYAQATIFLGFTEYANALRSAEAALSLYGELDDAPGKAQAQYIAGVSLVSYGDSLRGEQLLRAALEAARVTGNSRLKGLALQDIALARSADNDPEQARAYLAQALAVFRELGADRNATTTAINLAEFEFRAGNAEIALQVAFDALPAAQTRSSHFVTNLLGNISAYLIAVDRFNEARVHALSALDSAREMQLAIAVIWILQHLAALAALQQQRYVSAGRLIGFIDARLAALGGIRGYTEQQEYQRILNALQSRFDAAALTALQGDGALLEDGNAIAEAILNAG